MKQRNWLDLSRKLVDRYDLDYTLSGMSEILGKYASTFFGFGVLKTTDFPNPFPITLSGSGMTGTVGAGIAYSPNGEFTSIPSGTPSFTIPTSNPSNPRWDLLVLRYKQTGDSLIPKPSDPITMVYLNLLDDYELAVIPGTPSGSPAYPSKLSNDVILAGIKVPANASVGTTCVLDLSIRELAQPDIVKYPRFKQEELVGTVDGSNKVFTISFEPVSNSIAVFLNGGINYLTTEFTISGTTITFDTAPALGQIPYAWYVVMDPSSVNPLAAQQEKPTGVVDGSNDTFTLLGKSADKMSMLVLKNGSVSYENEWSLIQTPTSSQIKFLPGYVPEIGQSVYVFYFVNPATVGIAPIPGGGGNGWAPYGSIGSPVLVSAAGGVPFNNVQRQLIFVASNGGSVGITANPQVAPGVSIGQEMMLRGTSDVNYITLADGNGLSLNGSINMTSNQTLLLVWDGAVWVEVSRRW